ncbi:helix-turn-helix domain-containing protein [Aquimarina sp. 2201CG5-10]|uniref:helix-turn-helix domain-containing protein n=1 Tax=Aquimarina callyspongiae TaxID=3098150 RepID=UPI002AB4793B|nr:helix-turn-helix domain-containing protein [Aquimarina sp. 2201CG5-10]MDY8135697.1 helix-turn-helix domain-containing protein [Aquimarina sp. 2201CG5-10]
MNFNFSFINIIILFGAIQGFTLCWFLYQKKKINFWATNFFILFLFSLAFFNATYALMDMDLFRLYRPLHVFPFPYKYLIGVGFYFYVKSNFKQTTKKRYHIKEFYLFIPAIVYALLRSYWFSIAVKENSFRITKVVVDSNFFRINEIVYLVFTMILILVILKFLKTKEQTFSAHRRQHKNLQWLKRFSKVYLSIIITHLVLFSTDLIMHNGKESLLFYYPNLILNSTFIYWIGYIGYTKSRLLITEFKSKTDLQINTLTEELKEKLHQAIAIEQVYKNPNLTISELASQLNVNSKDLSNYINEESNMNFSEYLNYYRVEKVKKLLIAQESQKFTLLAIAEKAGFSSKSSFNAIFKKLVGETPSAYRKRMNTD